MDVLTQKDGKTESLCPAVDVFVSNVPFIVFNMAV